MKVGLDIGVIGPQMFTMLLVMALVTTVMTSPLLTLFTRNTELGGGAASRRGSARAPRGATARAQGRRRASARHDRGAPARERLAGACHFERVLPASGAFQQPLGAHESARRRADRRSPRAASRLAARRGSRGVRSCPQLARRSRRAQPLACAPYFAQVNGAQPTVEAQTGCRPRGACSSRARHDPCPTRPRDRAGTSRPGAGSAQRLRHARACVTPRGGRVSSSAEHEVAHDAERNGQAD